MSLSKRNQTDEIASREEKNLTSIVSNSPYSLFSDLNDNDIFKNLSHEQHQKILSILKQQLCKAIVSGDEKHAENIIEKHPSFLFERETVIDLSGNSIKDVTPLELSYLIEDYKMFSMFLPYLDENGRQKAFSQIKETYKECKTNQPYDFTSIVNAIKKNKNVDEELEKFREYFKPKVIERGQKVFNISNLINADFEINFYSMNDKKTCFFFKNIVGYLERMLPTHYAQAICQGLHYVIEQEEPLERRLTLDDGTSFYPKDLTQKSGLGFDYGIDTAGELAQYYKRGWGITTRSHTSDSPDYGTGCNAGYMGRYLKKYAKDIQHKFHNLLESAPAYKYQPH